MLGKKALKIGTQDFLYTGEMDSDGRSHGYGCAVIKWTNVHIVGTFCNDLPHGICEYLQQLLILIFILGKTEKTKGEYKNGVLFGSTKLAYSKEATKIKKLCELWVS